MDGFTVVHASSRTNSSAEINEATRVEKRTERLLFHNLFECAIIIMRVGELQINHGSAIMSDVHVGK